MEDEHSKFYDRPGQLEDSLVEVASANRHVLFNGSADRPSAQPSSNRRTKGTALTLTCLTFLWLTLGGGHSFGSIWEGGANDFFTPVIFSTKAESALCPQVEPLFPSSVENEQAWKNANAIFKTPEFRSQAVSSLSGAVKIPTESFDGMGPIDEDPRWLGLVPFQKYLLTTFPLIHSNLSLTKVNTYGLLYEWEGAESSLRSLLLAAHQDVVPVDPNTVDQWVHPPYSGFYDGTKIWGRGSSDDKSGLIAIMRTIETLLETGFKPKRKIVLAFGFDEEISGRYGARTMGDYMLSKFGENAFAMVVDEGGGFSKQHGGIFATPGIGEKGTLNVRVEVTSPGGHSSVPPPHTSIGILASLLVHYEANPYPPTIDRSTPVYGTMQCVAAHAPDVPDKLRKAILKSTKSDKALKTLEGMISSDVPLRSLVGTTQAIDLINGGVKTNALPEQAWAVVNHRIASQSSVAEVKDHDTKLLQSLASDFNLSYIAFGEKITSVSGPAFGTLALSDATGTALEPAPITSIDGEPYKLLAGTIKATYNAHRNFKNADEVVVAPGIPSGNTDTRFYWGLSKHIFRYNHHNSGSGGPIGNGVHTVNESINVDSFLEMIKFFAMLILNVDESSKI